MLNFQTNVQGRTADERINALAEALSAVHGPVHIRSEAGGLQAYMACPSCLDMTGRRELDSRHLAINLEKYLRVGKHAGQPFRPNSKKQGYCMCMKCNQKFTFQELLGYLPLDARGYIIETSQLVVRSGESRYLVPGPDGTLIPDGPGRVRSLLALPSDHPAILFLLSRNYDPVKLVSQFDAAWCDEEAPEGEQYCRWYRKHYGGWKSTPQQRVVFYSRTQGVPVCWQGRYLEIDSEDGVPLVWHPYDKCWQIRPPWEKGQEPAKYNTATGSFRNAQLCGYDAVVAAARLRDEEKTCILSEGPLDAARFPEHGMAVLGKHLSEAQALLLVAAGFRRAILAFDCDIHGFQACTKAAILLGRYGIRTLNFFRPEEGFDAAGNPVKLDPGKLTYEVAQERRQQLLLDHPEF